MYQKEIKIYHNCRGNVEVTRARNICIVMVDIGNL